MSEIPTLTELAIDKLKHLLGANRLQPKLINDVCKILPDHLLEPILEYLLNEKFITDVALIQFLVPSRTRLHMPGATNIMNSTIKQIGYNCPYLVKLMPFYHIEFLLGF